jgi:hypothetical protein
VLPRLDYPFAHDVVERVQIDALREHLDALVDAGLS